MTRLSLGCAQTTSAKSQHESNEAHVRPCRLNPKKDYHEVPSSFSLMYISYANQYLGGCLLMAAGTRFNRNESDALDLPRPNVLSSHAMKRRVERNMFRCHIRIQRYTHNSYNLRLFERLKTLTTSECVILPPFVSGLSHHTSHKSFLRT